jgi:zinc protease
VALPLDPATLRIPVEVATLDNGLRVVARRDRKSPIVAVHIAYRAGSREEPPGKHGLAHLFEHLMFSGSEHSPKNFFIPMERIGATSINAHVADDYAAYFATVPVAALDYVLWMEVERMSCLAAVLKQASLDRQRDIVGNELLQREAEPYGRAASLIRRDSYPRSHPYAHHPYGVLEDLDNIFLDDVLRWYETYYHPANATLVIAGDIEPHNAIENARRRFGPLASGPVNSQNVTGPVLASEARLTLHDEHAPPRIYRIWNAPGVASLECAEMELACEILAGGESSPLRKRMIEEIGLATNVSIEFEKRELGSQVILSAIAASGSRLSDLESELDAALSRLLGEMASERDCASAKARILARFLRETERVGGRSGKAYQIATLDLATGDPNFVGAHLERLASLDSRRVVESAARWLRGGGSSEISLRQRDEPQLRAGQSRDTIPPAVPSVPTFRCPHVARVELDNGLRVIAGERPGTRMVELRLVFEYGAALDDLNESGLASVAMRLLGRIRMEENEGNLANALARDGSTFRARATLDGSSVEISTLPDHLANVLAFLRRVVITPEFDQSDLARAESDAIASIRDEAARPFDLALRVFPRLVYPDGHPYTQPFSGSGTEEGVARVTVERVRDFYSRSMCANRATVIAIGPVEASVMVAQVKRALEDWRPSSELSTQPPIPKFEGRRSEAISLIDRRGMAQAAIFAALVLPPHQDPDIDGLIVADAILGGTFNSRLNLAFREQSGWSYGAYSRMFHARHGGLWIAYSFVHRDRAVAALEEMRRQLPTATQGHPIDDLEFASARDHLIATLPARYETNDQLADALQEAVLHDLPDDYHANFASRLAHLHPQDFRAECARWINEANITWIVIGEAERLQAEMPDRL